MRLQTVQEIQADINEEEYVLANPGVYEREVVRDAARARRRSETLLAYAQRIEELQAILEGYEAIAKALLNGDITAIEAVNALSAHRLSARP